MLKRTAWEDLLAWKNRPHHPLVISGMRQVGKTYLVRAFGKQCYESVVYLDLRDNTSIHQAFAGDFDIDKMVMSITANDSDARFHPGNTLLILDEIQDCPNARSSLKYWDLDGRYDVIATGSFLGVKGFRSAYARGIPVGYEEHYTMGPLSFGEFMLNMGVQYETMEHVKEALMSKTAVLPAVHERMRDLYYQYVVVGGMPEVVKAFLENRDLNRVREIQRDILLSIRDDFGRSKDASGNDKVNGVLKLRAEACLDSLPSQLAKEYKKFQYSLVNTKGHSPQKAEGLQYLLDVGLAIQAFNIREIASPLEGSKIPNEFKVYYRDTGLLVSQLEIGAAAQVLQGNLGAYKGAIAENIVASALVANGMQPYYYRNSSGSPELDFVFSNKGNPVLVECKASNKRMTSMRYVLDNPKKYGKHYAVKFADANVGGGEGFITYPHYALGFLREEKIETLK